MVSRRLGFMLVSAVLVWDGVSKVLSGVLYGRVRMEGIPPVATGWPVRGLGALEVVIGLALGLWLIRGWMKGSS
jgi:hypothetical protein